MGKTLRVQSHLCGGWEGKRRGHRRHVPGQPGVGWQTGPLARWNTLDHVSLRLQDPPRRLLGPVSWRNADVASID